MVITIMLSMLSLMGAALYFISPLLSIMLFKTGTGIFAMGMQATGVLLMACIPLLFAVRLSTSKALKLFEGKIPGKELCVFIRRDGECIPLYASRPFFGESFLENEKIGLIHDLGRGSVFRWGNKSIRFILENVPYTPEIKYVNFANWLHSIGFNNLEQVKEALNDGLGSDIINKLDEPVQASEILKKELLNTKEDIVFDSDEKEKENLISFLRGRSHGEK